MAKTAALIMAAGAGERFSGKETKTFSPLLGKPVLVWSAGVFARHGRVDAITLVVAPGDERRAIETLKAHGIPKIARVVPGGSARQESVRLGLDALDPSFEMVLIHDAVRPCVTPGLIDRVIESAATDGAVVPVCPVVDTLVHEKDGAVDAILDRVHVSGVQTPQGFGFELILRAHRRAKARGLSSSDDGSLVFAMGEKVRTIRGERTNIKITFLEDAAIAEAILRRTGVTVGEGA
jgi:2-C-methyl-D-erythritol 4-phosphate cytidylyltransferase